MGYVLFVFSFSLLLFLITVHCFFSAIKKILRNMQKGENEQKESYTGEAFFIAFMLAMNFSFWFYWFFS